MKKRLFAYTTLITFAGLLCFFAASVYISNGIKLNMATDAVIETTRICAGLYSEDCDASAFVKVGGDTRITIIAADGKVLADSRPLDFDAIENHLSRPEIQAAAEGSPAAHIRHSGTLGIDFIYYALKVECSDSYVFMRSAIPISRIDTYFRGSMPLLIILLLAVALLCFIFSRHMINRITKPFESIESRLRLLTSGAAYTSEPVVGSYQEINTLIQGIDEVAQVVQSSLADLWDEKNKLDYILRNIGDGLFVLDDDMSIMLVNSAALGIFNVNQEIVGKNLNYITNEKTLFETVRDCVNHEEDALFESEINGRIFLTAVKRLPNTILTMVVMSDVTENRENAKRREEFFANASHELKTPLTAIKGFNELAAINNTNEGISKYIESITRETDRMLALIDDMLKLSELENTQGLNPVPISIAKVAAEVRETLSSAISKKSVSLDIIGDGIVEAEPSHAYELVKNIIENAVRYNNDNGRINVSIESGNMGTWLFVFDNGIGISPQEQSRIFERFYRVEKSRSQRSGGTGLGLSIVKHICALYGWKVSLKSKLGVGTEVTVEFGMPADS